MIISKILSKLINRIHGRSKSVAFLHVPKTGGTYINQAESEKNAPVIYPYKKLSHTYFTDNSKNPIYEYHNEELAKKVTKPLAYLKHYTIFSNVRNPFSYFVSYLFHAGYKNTRYYNPDHYDYDNAIKGFDYLLKTIANRDDIWPNRKFLYCQLFSSDGDFVADWINRQETLDMDLKAMAANFNINYRKASKQRVGGYRDYREFYAEDHLVDLVYTTWGREMRLFGYDFDGVIENFFSLHQLVNAGTKSRIKYFLNDDVLIIDGKSVLSREFVDSPIIDSLKPENV